MLLKIEKLNKIYPNGVQPINQISLTINKGMFGLLGPNGAGKSSLMRTIATLQQPDSGSLEFNDINVLNNPFALRKQLGYLPQEFGVYPKQSALDLLHYFAILKGISSKKQRSLIIDQLLELTNLYDDRKKYVSNYSGGMKQRFGIAQLLLNDPKLIIVDEPTAGLDPAERNRFLNVLREISAERIVIFSTHLVEDVKELCADMAVMNHGKIVLHRTPSAAIKEFENCIWTTSIKKEKLENLEQTFSVLSKNYNEDNNLTVRIYSNTQPSLEFKSTIPTLEDAYFIHLNSTL